MNRDKLDNPVATGRLHWLPGGRRLGPPPGPVFSAKALPGINAIRLHDVLLSIRIERTGQLSDEGELVQVGFLVPCLADPHLYPGAGWTILQGLRPVAELSIKAVLIKSPY
ncbi:hypothetical protein [Nocardia sp. NPDC048505]|uniref:hypothetical protein n=1 Tax=unclassified Nocardia TaxID=2637762 RepID=UPI0033E864FF